SPPARSTRSASENAERTTTTRAPVATRARGSPTRPLQDSALARSEEGDAALPPLDEVTSTAPATRAANTAAAIAPLRNRIRIEAERVAGCGDVPRRGGDHRGVVGAQRERRRDRLGQRGAELGVRRDAADDRDRVRGEPFERLAGPLDERADDRALVGGGEIRPPRLELVGRQRPDGVQKGGLDAGEREVETRHLRDREVEGVRVALAREEVDRRAARIAEAQQPCPLVERLPGGVVQRGADDAEAAPV